MGRWTPWSRWTCAEGGGVPDGPAAGAQPSDAALVAELFGVNEPERRPSVAAQALTITAAELEFMDRVAPLLGETPRAVKRFTNVYLLVKSIARHSGRDMSGQHAQVILLLAIATGQPALASPLFRQIEVPGSGATTLADAVARHRLVVPRVGRQPLARERAGHGRDPDRGSAALGPRSGTVHLRRPPGGAGSSDPPGSGRERSLGVSRQPPPSSEATAQAAPTTTRTTPVPRATAGPPGCRARPP